MVPCESLRVCCEYENIGNDPPAFETQKSCGHRNVDGLGKFSFGRQNEAQFGEFPWMMAVMKKIRVRTQDLNVYIAGGSLIHASVVLTTAHNLVGTNVNDVRIRAGEWNTQSVDEMLNYVERDVLGITFHEKFTRANLQNDIALMFLNQPFPMQPHINIICLPQNNFVSEGENCISSGWGKHKFGKTGSYQEFLKKVELPIVANDICEEQLRKTRLGEDFELHDGFMCAGKSR